MNTFRASFRHEIISNSRSRSPQLIVVVFLLLTSLSSLIGWLTVRNVTRIYADIVKLGLTKAPNPFLNVPPLYYMRNCVIYIVLVGSLMAIVLGAQASLRDRKSSADSLIRTRNVSLLQRNLGQLGAIGAILAGLEIAVLAASLGTIWLIRGNFLDTNSLLHLLLFGVLSWLLMFGVACVGFVAGLFARSEESALLYPFIGWAVITFTIPQLITSTHPVALLNPTPAISVGTGLTQSIVDTLSPLMLMEHFKAISNTLLSIDTNIPLTALSILSFSLFVLVAPVGASAISMSAFGRKLND